VIDGEAVACGADGWSNFDFIRYRRHDQAVFLYAFDLLQLDVEDLRRDPLEVRKATLQSILSNSARGIRYNEHIEGDAEDIFRHACWRASSVSYADRPFRSGRPPHRVKIKDPDCDAVRRETEEDWGPRPMRVRR
jgi:bifunctional non-homologous end joining protein LigD